MQNGGMYLATIQNNPQSQAKYLLFRQCCLLQYTFPCYCFALGIPEQFGSPGPSVSFESEAIRPIVDRHLADFGRTEPLRCGRHGYNRGLCRACRFPASRDGSSRFFINGLPTALAFFMHVVAAADFPFGAPAASTAATMAMAFFVPVVTAAGFPFSTPAASSAATMALIVAAFVRAFTSTFNSCDGSSFA